MKITLTRHSNTNNVEHAAPKISTKPTKMNIYTPTIKIKNKL